MAQEINWRGGGHGEVGCGEEKASGCISHNVAFPGVGRREACGQGSECGQPLGLGCFFPVLPARGNIPSATMVAWGRNLPQPADSKASKILLIWSEIQPEADIAIAPPAGSLRKKTLNSPVWL